MTLSHQSCNVAYRGKTSQGSAVDALLTLSSKGQLVIPARLRQLLGLQAGDRLALTLEADGLRLIPGLIQSPSQGPLPGLSACVEVGGIASSLCSKAFPPQLISI